MTTNTTVGWEWVAGDKVRVFTSAKGYAKGIVVGVTSTAIQVKLRNGRTPAFHPSRVHPSND